MSAASTRRYVVSAFDYGLWQAVVEAGSRDEALRKAESLYLADGLGCTECFTSCERDVTWQAEPLVGEVRP